MQEKDKEKVRIIQEEEKDNKVKVEETKNDEREVYIEQ